MQMKNILSGKQNAGKYSQAKYLHIYVCIWGWMYVCLFSVPFNDKNDASNSM